MKNHALGIDKKDKIFYCILVLLTTVFFFISISSVELFITNDKYHKKEFLNRALYSTAQSITQQIHQSISSGISTTESLFALLSASAFNVTDFEIWAKSIFKSNPNVNAIQLAPDGIVQYIYPMKGHEAALGHDLLSDQRRNDGALQTIKDRTLTFIGPVKLIQNGKLAVIARLPIYRGNGQDEKFWGFTIALIYVKQILSVELEHLQEIGIEYQLEGSNPDSQEISVLASSGSYKPHKDEMVVPIKVPNGTWSLHLHNNKIHGSWYLPLRISSGLMSIFIAFFICIMQIRMRKQAIQIMELNKTLEELSYQDELTSLDNRRSAMKILSNLVFQGKRYDEPLTICLMDVDLFKSVNDNFGHPAGDACLRHVAVLVKSIVRESDVLARIGGDEFLCIFPRTNLESAQIIVEKMRQQLDCSPLMYENRVVALSLSFGIAEFNKNQCIDELISAADVQLYRAKKAGRNKVATESIIL